MEYTPRMKANAAIARRAAAESMVLLKNEQTLPLEPKTKLAVFGIGQIYTIKGGTGSGEVNNVRSVNVLEGLSACEDLVVDELAARAYRAWALAHPQERHGMFGGSNRSSNEEMPIGQLDLEALAAANDAAVIVISRIAGEGADLDPAALQLTAAESDMVRAVCQAFEKTILLLNTPGYLEIADYLPGVTAVLFIGLPGQEGGGAVADVLTGAVTVGGKLSDTWPLTAADFPGTFDALLPNGNLTPSRRGDPAEQTNVPYDEDIFVGYRYFDTFGKAVLFPFGYGLSYGNPILTQCSVALDQATITVTAEIVNDCETQSAREVVQVYVSAPDGRLEQPYQKLLSFAKTAVLAPGAAQTVRMTIPAEQLASYDAARAAYVLEPGRYEIRVGVSSRDTTVAATLEVADEICTLQLKNLFGDVQEGLLRKRGAQPITYSGEAQERKQTASKAIRLSAREFTTRTVKYAPEYVPAQPKPGLTLVDVAEGRGTCEELAATMELSDLCRLVCGQGMDMSGFDLSALKKENDTFANAAAKLQNEVKFEVPGEAGQSPDLWEQYGITPLVLCDGPAGVRLTRDIRDDDGEITAHQYCTAFPVGSLLACAFDPALLEEFGKAVGTEMNEYGVDLWLAPGMNIHRNPLGGRSFEYFSEDPVLTGQCAAAITRGVQSQGAGVTIKHFAGNSQEFMRGNSNDIVSERALREIYLRGFEIAVRDGKPKAVMTAYNDINGVPCADNRDLCTALLRDEWGFDGLVMTDWGGAISTPAISMWAGNDMIQPGGRQAVDALQAAVERGEPVTSNGLRRVSVTPTRAVVERSAAHIMNVVLRSVRFKRKK